MAQNHEQKGGSLADQQETKVELCLGRNAALSASLRVTNGGLLAVAGLVSAVLLSTAVLVRVVLREGRKVKRARQPLT